MVGSCFYYGLVLQKLYMDFTGVGCRSFHITFTMNVEIENHAEKRRG